MSKDIDVEDRTVERAKKEVLAQIEDKRDFALSIRNNTHTGKGKQVAEEKLEIWDSIIKHVEDEF